MIEACAKLISSFPAFSCDGGERLKMSGGV
jgi:hypothetical protein